jgi:hypothetical protein
VEARPEIVGNCCVFLNWCDPNDSDYDAEAVDLLRPCGIVAVIERFGGGNGAAGGKRFHELYEQGLGDAGSYVRFEEAQAFAESITGGLDVRLVWLHRRDDESHPLPEAYKPRILVDKIPSTFQTITLLGSLIRMVQISKEMRGLRFAS